MGHGRNINRRCIGLTWSFTGPSEKWKIRFFLYMSQKAHNLIFNNLSNYFSFFVKEFWLTTSYQIPILLIKLLRIIFWYSLTTTPCGEKVRVACPEAHRQPRELDQDYSLDGFMLSFRSFAEWGNTKNMTDTSDQKPDRKRDCDIELIEKPGRRSYHIPRSCFCTSTW